MERKKLSSNYWKFKRKAISVMLFNLKEDYDLHIHILKCSSDWQFIMEINLSHNKFESEKSQQSRSFFQEVAMK